VSTFAALFFPGVLVALFIIILVQALRGKLPDENSDDNRRRRLERAEDDAMRLAFPDETERRAYCASERYRLDRERHLREQEALLAELDAIGKLPHEERMDRLSKLIGKSSSSE
jgi:hypothetical protein